MSQPLIVETFLNLITDTSQCLDRHFNRQPTFLVTKASYLLDRPPEHAYRIACGVAVTQFVQVSKKLDQSRSVLTLTPTETLENNLLDSVLVVYCQSLSQPDHGHISMSERKFESTANFSCNEGFIIHGSSNRTCLKDGSWSGTETVCRGKLSNMTVIQC